MDQMTESHKALGEFVDSWKLPEDAVSGSLSQICMDLEHFEECPRTINLKDTRGNVKTSLFC